MPSSLWTVVLVALFLLASEITSASQVFRQNHNRVFIFQIPLQQLDPKISPRTPDLTTTEDSYIVALRESQINRNKGSVPAIGQHHHHHAEDHHHTESHHDFAKGANKQFNGQHHSTEVPETHEHVLTTRPLTAMEKNYLWPHRPQLIKKHAVHSSHIGELNQSVDASDEGGSEEVMERSGSDGVAILATRPFSTVSDVNSIYSAYSSNARRVVNKKSPSIRKSFEITETTTVKTSESGSKKPQETRQPIKKTLQIKVGLPDVLGVMTNKAANVVRSGMKTVGSTIGIPMRNGFVGKVNSLLPVVAALSVGRKKRSIPEELQEAKGWKDNIHNSRIRTLGYMKFLAKLLNKPLESAPNTNKFYNAGKRPLWLQLTRSTNSIRNDATKEHSAVKRSTNLKMENFRNTTFKRVIPWHHSAFSRNTNIRKESQVTGADIAAEKGHFMDENEVNVEPLTSASSMTDSPNTEPGKYQSEQKETRMEQNVEVDVLPSDEENESSTLMPELKDDELETVDKYTHGHGVIVPPTKVPDSDGTHNYSHGHGAVIPPENENDSDDEDVSKYTHGHGVIVANPLEGSNLLTGEPSGETANVDSNNENLSSSPDDPYITTGIFGDELDSELDNLGSLMTDIFIAPLPVEAVVAEESDTVSSLDSSDAIIIESAEEETKPDSVLAVGSTAPVVSNFANLFIASSGSGTSTTSSSSSTSGSISSGGITGSSTSAASIDPFASLYTFGLAAIGIFVLSLPIWVPIVATKMKRRRNKLIRNRGQSDFSTASLYTDMEFNPYSILIRNLMPPNSEEPFSDPGPLKSEEVYGPATSHFGDRLRGRRSIRAGNTGTRFSA